MKHNYFPAPFFNHFIQASPLPIHALFMFILKIFTSLFTAPQLTLDHYRGAAS